MRVVVDAAHGAAYRVAPLVFSELGANVSAIGVKPNGVNINREAGALHPDHAGQGFATEAAAAMLEQGFEGLGLHRIVGRVDARNDASSAVLKEALACGVPAVATSIGGDIARLGEERIVITPPGVRIWRGSLSG